MRQAKGNVEEAKRLLQYTDDTYRTIGAKTGCSHGTIVRLGKVIRAGSKKSREAERWKAEHDDLMGHYKRLESQLEAYQSNDNPQMVSKLNEALGWKDEEIRDLNKKLVRADGERDEAMQYAKEMKERYEQVIRESKEYEMEYEARYLNIKGQLDAMVKAYNLQREFTE